MKKSGHLRSDAWCISIKHWLKPRSGIYVILDLHGAVGSRGWEHREAVARGRIYFGRHQSINKERSGCGQVAGRYKDRAVVAGYSLLNEPWALPKPKWPTWSRLCTTRCAVSIQARGYFLPGHAAGINAYGNPAQAGMKNVAFEMRFSSGFRLGGNQVCQCIKNGCTAVARAMAVYVNGMRASKM